VFVAVGNLAQNRGSTAPLDAHRSIERFNRTLADDWAYVRVYRRNIDRDRALDRWLLVYDHHPSHAALGGNPPTSRVNNVPSITPR
jgi:hypothetical protein